MVKVVSKRPLGIKYKIQIPHGQANRDQNHVSGLETFTHTASAMARQRLQFSFKEKPSGQAVESLPPQMSARLIASGKESPSTTTTISSA